MPRARQFQQMIPGTTFGAGATKDRWTTALSGGPAGYVYYISDELDLRGLLMGDETGVGLTNLTIQEAGPWSTGIAGETGWFMVYDLLTTQRPTEEVIGGLFEQPSIPGDVPGFLIPTDTAKNPDQQDFNPSQVVWGMWRFWGINRDIQTGTTQGIKVMQSGFIGTQQPIVSPGAFWTRVIVPYQDGDAFTVPSTNLLSQGFALDLSVPQELTQMMRAVQR